MNELVPEEWAKEPLLLLQQNMLTLGMVVHPDFIHILETPIGFERRIVDNSTYEQDYYNTHRE